MAFHLPHVRILGTNHCGYMRRTSFKQRELFQDFICRSDYAERLVARFYNQIKSSMSIEGIALKYFSAAPQ